MQWPLWPLRAFMQKLPHNPLCVISDSLTMEKDSTALYSCVLHESKARWHCWVLHASDGAWPWVTPSSVHVLLRFRSREFLRPFPFISWKLNWAGFYPGHPSLSGFSLISLSLSQFGLHLSLGSDVNFPVRFPLRFFFFIVVLYKNAAEPELSFPEISSIKEISLITFHFRLRQILKTRVEGSYILCQKKTRVSL